MLLNWWSEGHTWATGLLDIHSRRHYMEIILCCFLSLFGRSVISNFLPLHGGQHGPQAYLSLTISQRLWVTAAQLCPTFSDPIDCSLSDSSVHGILQTRILEWVSISFSRGSSQPRDQTQVSCIVGRFYYLPEFVQTHVH